MRRLESNRFTLTKTLICEKMYVIGRQWNNALNDNRGINIIRPLEMKYYDLVDINTKLASMKLRRY